MAKYLFKEDEKTFKELLPDYNVANLWANTNYSPQEDFYASYQKGIRLYNSILEKYEQSNGKNVVFFDEAGSIERFISFVRENIQPDLEKSKNVDWSFYKTLYLFAGEGTAMSKAISTLREKAVKDWFWNLWESIDHEIIIGPFVKFEDDLDNIHQPNQLTADEWSCLHYEEKWRSRINNYIQMLLAKKRTFKLYSNAYAPFHKLFLGAFHFYLFGDCFLVEAPHQYNVAPVFSDGKNNNNIQSSDGKRGKIMMRDKELADELRAFFINYSQKFSYDVKNDELSILKKFKTVESSRFDEIYNMGCLDAIREKYSFDAQERVVER